MNGRPAAVLLIVLFLSLFSIPAVAQPGPPDFEVTPAERAEVIENAIAELNAIYVFPETAKKMEQSLRARVAKGEYASITSARELAQKMTDDLREVSRDKHLQIFHFANGVPAAPEQPSSASDQQLEYLRKVNFGFEKVERMQGNVGYIEVRGFPPASLGGETASAAMNFVAHADALIIDLRRNGGGEPSMIAHLMSYLFDEPTHLNDIWERVGDKTQQWWTSAHVPGPRFGGTKPVYVLTSSRTFSGGEEFANNVKTRKRGLLVGETTGGGAHPVRAVKVSARFSIGIPFARAINPITGTNWEGTGVEPDVKMAADKALDAAYWMAIEKIAETTTNERQKHQLLEMLREKESKQDR